MLTIQAGRDGKDGKVVEAENQIKEISFEIQKWKRRKFNVKKYCFISTHQNQTQLDFIVILQSSTPIFSRLYALV